MKNPNTLISMMIVYVEGEFIMTSTEITLAKKFDIVPFGMYGNGMQGNGIGGNGCEEADNKEDFIQEIINDLKES